MEVMNMHTQPPITNAVTHFEQPKKRRGNHTFEHRTSTNYTETLLKEYKTLVELLAHLDAASFQKMKTEVNVVIDRLKQWFQQPSSNNTLEIYWAMRRLRQKVRSRIQLINKKPIRFRNKLFTLR